MKNTQELLSQLQELEADNERLKDFVENAAVPLHKVDSTGIIIWANQAELDLMGYTIDEYIGKNIRSFHVHQMVIEDIINKLAKGDTLHNYPATLRCKNGNLKQVLISSNLRTENGKFAYTRCFTRDITDLREQQNQMSSLIERLERSEQTLKMAMESTGLGTWDFDLNTGVLICSTECRNIFGLSKEQDVNYQLFTQLTHPKDLKEIEDSIFRSLESKGDQMQLNFRIQRANDGTLRYVKTQGRVYLDSYNNPKRFFGTLSDVTETTLAAEKVARSEKLFKSIALNMPRSMVLVIDMDHRFRIVQGELMDKLGYHSGDYEGKHPREVAPEERYLATKHLYERMLSGEKFSEHRKGQHDDEYLVHFIPLRDEQEEVYSGLIIVQDITHMSVAEEKSAKLAAIIESSDDAIISKSLESIVTSWNHSAQRIFGYTEEEMIGQPITKLIPEDRLEEEPQIVAKLKKGERVDHFETIRRTKDGNLLNVSLTISPIKNTAGEIIGVSKIARDITEKKREEARKNDFVAMVSHELKTPLTSMLGYVQVLLNKTKAAEDSFVQTALQKTEIQVKKMTGMVHDFLNVARLEEGKIHLKKEIFPLGELAKEVVENLQLVTTTHHLTLLPINDISLYGDREKIGQVLSNLITNSIKYSPSGTRIEIGCALHNGQANTFVKDEGIGISAEDQSKLFERFYRVATSKSSVTGFGIGLYLVSEILRMHHTVIKVESELGKGSTFSFEMPIR